MHILIWDQLLSLKPIEISRLLVFGFCFLLFSFLFEYYYYFCLMFIRRRSKQKIWSARILFYFIFLFWCTKNQMRRSTTPLRSPNTKLVGYPRKYVPILPNERGIEIQGTSKTSISIFSFFSDPIYSARRIWISNLFFLGQSSHHHNFKECRDTCWKWQFVFTYRICITSKHEYTYLIK